MRDPDPEHLAALRARAAGPPLTLFRHPKLSAEGVIYGRADPPLAPEAPRQIEDALRRAEELRLSPPEIIASPAPRARALAEPLAALLGVALRIDERLIELDFGAWEMALWKEVDRALSEPWLADPWRLSPPGGETLASLTERVAEALGDAPEGAVLVCHAGPIRAARMLRQGMSLARSYAEPAPYAAPVPMPAVEGPATGGNGGGDA